MSIDFSSRLSDHMKKHSISQYKLWKSSGVSQATISEILSGKTSPTQNTVEKILNGLKISEAEFYKEKTAQQLAVEELIRRRPPAETDEERYADALFDALSDEEKEKRLSQFLQTATVEDGKLEYKLIEDKELLEMLDKLQKAPPQVKRAIKDLIDFAMPRRE